MVVVVKKSDKGDKKDNGTTYVYLASRKAVFVVAGEVKRSKYSYGVPIVPLYGRFRAKDGKVYDAKDLAGRNVVLNVNDDDLVNAIRKAKLVVVGFDEDDVLVVEGGE